MVQKDLESANTELSKIDSVDVSNGVTVPFKLFDRKSNKTTKLAATDPKPESMKGRKRWYEFSFTEPVFVSEILVDTQKYGSSHSFKIQWVDIEGISREKIVSGSDDGRYYTTVNNLIRKISFKPPTVFFANPEIDAVTVYGFARSDLDDLVSVAANLDSYKSKIMEECNKAIQNAQAKNSEVVALEAKETALHSEISNLEQKAGQARSELGGFQTDVGSSMSELSLLQDNINSSNARLAEIESSIGSQRNERDSISNEVSEKKGELTKLKEDINLFPTEISGFAAEGSKNTISYAKWAIVPMLLLLVMTGLLVFNAAELTTVLDENDGAKIWSIFVTRLPYLAIATAIIGVSFKILQVLIAEVMRINKQRLNLSKVSIIATDVSTSSEQGLGLSDEERYALRTQLKMELLREHLKEYLPSEYEYKTNVDSGRRQLISDSESSQENEDEGA